MTENVTKNATVNATVIFFKYGHIQYSTVRYGDASGINSIEILYKIFVKCFLLKVFIFGRSQKRFGALGVNDEIYFVSLVK